MQTHPIDVMRAWKYWHEVTAVNTFKASKDGDDLLNEVEASDILRVSTRTLQAWRCRGTGPSFVKVGRSIRYRRSDLTMWTQGNTVHPGRIATPNHQ